MAAEKEDTMFSSVPAVLGVILCATAFVLAVRAYRRQSRRRRLEAYQETLLLLHCMICDDPKRALGFPIAPLGMDAVVPFDRERTLKAVRSRAVEILTRWTEQDVADVSGLVLTNWLEHGVPFEEVEEFLRCERDMVLADRSAVDLHLVRLIVRFKEGRDAPAVRNPDPMLH